MPERAQDPPPGRLPVTGAIQFRNLSLALNVFYAALKLVCGALYRSVWFGTLAVYYLLLAVMRFVLLRHARQSGFGADVAAELRRYRSCGLILMLMNVALSGVVVLVVRGNEDFRYPGYRIYLMAMYVFYNIITAVRNVAKYRRYNSPAMSAAKAVSLAAALVSMLSLETAMLAQFDNGANPEAFRRSLRRTCGGSTGTSPCAHRSTASTRSRCT